MKKILTIMLTAMLVLTGCSSSQEKTFTMSKDRETVEIKITYKDNKVSKEDATMTLTFPSIESNKENLKNAEKQSRERFENKQGVTYSSEIKDYTLTQKITIDHSKADKEWLKGLIYYRKVINDKNEIMLDKYEEYMKESGFTEKK